MSFDKDTEEIRKEVFGEDKGEEKDQKNRSQPDKDEKNKGDSPPLNRPTTHILSEEEFRKVLLNKKGKESTAELVMASDFLRKNRGEEDEGRELKAEEVRNEYEEYLLQAGVGRDKIESYQVSVADLRKEALGKIFHNYYEEKSSIAFNCVVWVPLVFLLLGAFFLEPVSTIEMGQRQITGGVEIFLNFERLFLFFILGYILAWISSVVVCLSDSPQEILEREESRDLLKRVGWTEEKEIEDQEIEEVVKKVGWENVKSYAFRGLLWGLGVAGAGVVMVCFHALLSGGVSGEAMSFMVVYFPILLLFVLALALVLLLALVTCAVMSTLGMVIHAFLIGFNLKKNLN